MIGSLGIEGFFDEIVLADEVSAGKPDPEIFLLAAKALQLSPARCIVIEDAVTGVEAAKRAGMRCIAVTTSHPRRALAEADMVVDSLDDLASDAFELLLSWPLGAFQGVGKEPFGSFFRLIISPER